MLFEIFHRGEGALLQRVQYSMLTSMLGLRDFQHMYAAGTMRFYLQVSSESGVLCFLKPNPEI